MAQGIQYRKGLVEEAAVVLITSLLTEHWKGCLMVGEVVVVKGAEAEDGVAVEEEEAIGNFTSSEK